MVRLKAWAVWKAKRILKSLGLKTSKPRVVLPPKQAPVSARRYLAVAAIAWNEGPDLREWLEFQRLVGVEHVYLYDDGSTDNSAEIVRPYVSEGFVTYIPWASFFSNVSRQALAYAHALCTFGPGWRWMAFIDLDEYIFPVKEESLPAALSRYEDLPAIVIPWHMFGFCGHESRPPGLVIENYTQRLPMPPSARGPGLLHWKSIVDPLAVVAVDSPHFFILQNGKRGGYTENRLWIDRTWPRGWENLSSDVFHLNHYFTKSKEDFARRRSGGRSVVSRPPEKHKKRALEYVLSIEAGEAVKDNLILRYAPALRHKLVKIPKKSP